MKKNSLIILFLSFLIPSTSVAQNSIGGTYHLSLSYSSANVIQTQNTIEGSPYYKNSVIKGKVFLPNKKTTEVLTLALDFEENRLIFEEGDVFKIFNPDVIKGISFLDEDDNEEDFFINGFSSPENDITKNTFLRVIYNGETKVFAHHQKVFDRGNFRDPVTNRTKSGYKESTTYYIVRENGEFKKTRLKLKNLIKDLGEYEKELKDFAKENKIKGKSESDAFRILEYYDSLKKENS